jgi:phosphoenolpyruvate-protein phosphotransferase
VEPLRGVAASPGAAVGPAAVLRPAAAREAGSPEDEQARVREGLDRAAGELDDVAGRLRGEGRTDEAEVVETSALMARDPSLVEAAVALAAAPGTTAEAAIQAAAEQSAAVLAALDEPTLALRAADVRAVGRRAAAALTGARLAPPAGAVLVADDLGPAEVADAAGTVAAIVLAAGGATAHAAIVARSLGVPLVAAAGPAVLELDDGAPVAVDAGAGLVWPSPDSDTAAAVAASAARYTAERARDAAERDLPAVTRDGRRITLLANAGTVEEIEAALAAGAEGIGLLRTELAFLEAAEWPSEAAQRAVLTPMLRPLAGRVATVRTFDFGGDKTPSFLDAAAMGPLGTRGVRLSLAEPGVLDDQIRAIVQAAGEARLRVLVPMVTDARELEAVAAVVERAWRELAPALPRPLVGPMIEVPAAALGAGHLAGPADFFSIGTNDLVQYTLAADRLAAGLVDAVAHHPAVLRLVFQVVEAAHEAGIPVDVCGEAAGDPDAAPLLLGLGVDELSVSPARVGATRRLVRGLDAAQAARVAAQALECARAAETAALARSLQAGDEVGHGADGVIGPGPVVRADHDVGPTGRP